MDLFQKLSNHLFYSLKKNIVGKFGPFIRDFFCFLKIMLKNIETTRSECTAKKKKKKENMASSSTGNLIDFFCSNLLEDKDLETEIVGSIDVFTSQVG